MFICNVEKKTSKRRKNTSERQRTATECMANTNLGPCVCVCFIFIACSFLLKVSRFHCAKCFLFFLVFAGRFPSNAVLSNSNAVLVLIHEHDPLCASRFLHCNSLRRIYVALDSIPLYFSLTLSYLLLNSHTNDWWIMIFVIDKIHKSLTPFRGSACFLLS